MNQGLTLLSPIVLVRLLTVEQFGEYREFLLYVTILAALANVGLSNSLLYFIPSKPGATRQLLKQTAALTFAASFTIVVTAVIADVISGGALLGGYVWPVALYVFFFVNLDFWEFYWLARRRPIAALVYATGRLALRMSIVVSVAAVTGEITTIIWSIVGFEALRLLGSAAFWRRHVRDEPRDATSSWREQLRYCVPLAGASVLVMLNKQLGNFAVAKVMGAAALAHYAIGTQIQPIITVLRNSLSDAFLPDMAARQAEKSDPLTLWHRMTVVSMMLLIPTAIVLAKFAEPIITTLFTAEYVAAVPIFQLYLLALLREVFDFGVPLRAINQTGPIAHSNLFALIVNVGLLIVLLPRYGLIGAVIAFLVSRVVDGLYLAARVLDLYRVRVATLAPWRDLAKVAVANGVGAIALAGSMWTDQFGLAGVLLGAVAFAGVVFVMLWCLQLPEIARLVHGLRHAPAGLRSPR